MPWRLQCRRCWYLFPEGSGWSADGTRPLPVSARWRCLKEEKKGGRVHQARDVRACSQSPPRVCRFRWTSLDRHTRDWRRNCRNRFCRRGCRRTYRRANFCQDSSANSNVRELILSWLNYLDANSLRIANATCSGTRIETLFQECAEV